MASRCKLFEEKIVTVAREKMEIKDIGGGKASKYIDRGGAATTVVYGLAFGVTIALDFATFGAASFAGACVAGACVVAKEVVEKLKEKKVESVLTKAENAGVSSYLNLIILDVAKELSRIFEFQLFELRDDKEIEALAKCAVKLMLDLKEKDTFDRNTLIRKVLQDGKRESKWYKKTQKVLTRNNTEWSVPDVFRKPGLRKVILEKDVAEIKFFTKPLKVGKDKKDACDTITYGYRGQFLEMKDYGDQHKEDENVREEARERDEICKECFGNCNDKTGTSPVFFVESNIDSEYTVTQDEAYRYDALHILIQCPEILVSFSQQSAKVSLAEFLKEKLRLPQNLRVHPVYRPHSPAEVSNLENSDLTGSDFSHSDFSGACLKSCNFTKCVMLFAELDRANMCGSKFRETFIGHSKLRRVKADCCEWTNMSLLHSRVDNACLDSVVPSIGGNDFTGTNISDATTGQKPDINCNEGKCK